MKIPRFSDNGSTFFVYLLILLTLSLSMQSRSMAQDPVTVQLKWVHQAQFAGFYVAVEKGFYMAEHLDATLIEGGNKVDAGRSVASGTADFGVMAPEEIIIKRSQGLHLKAIAAIYRRSAVAYLARSESGITRPQDFIGKTVAAASQHGGASEFEFQLVAMMKNLGLDMASVKLVPYDPGYAGFYSGAVDVTGSYLTGGLIKMREKGLTPNIIWPGDYRVRFYSDTLATTDDMIADHPHRVTRFVRATLKGWRTAVGDPAGTIDIVMKYARIKDRALQTAMFNALLPLVHTGEDRIGWMHAAAWRNMHRVLVEQGIIKQVIDPIEQIYDLRFLEKDDPEREQ
ncbi:myristoyl transferase [Desulfosarcina ovata subsp. sediminis]|uniref:Thiamine pyrimidine synthase n=1 Tax=Desulfosarcina ovata subsp. sediminis TaxID=885957 RepID=A0A5K8A0Q0_9BACT|nr:ABC transporter substrate-binding protein [Desulfosarcina ovata]BBO86103.1 myristoyl transferase [Desulfosarcina ovata subsp. sediminis]